MGAFIAVVIVLVVVTFAIIGFFMSLAKMFEQPAQDLHVRWCAPCQGTRTYVNGRCMVCNGSNAESYRCQVEHCLLGMSDARHMGATQRLEGAQVAMLERFYLDGLNTALRQSGT